MQLRYMAGDGVERIISDRDTLDRLLDERELSKFSLITDETTGRTIKVQDYLAELEPGKHKICLGKSRAARPLNAVDSEALRQRRAERIHRRMMSILRSVVIFLIVLAMAGGIFALGMSQVAPKISDIAPAKEPETLQKSVLTPEKPSTGTPHALPEYVKKRMSPAKAQ